MRLHFNAYVFALIAVTLAVAGCSAPSGPGEPSNSADCVTDFACAHGTECGGGGCADVAASIRPHIQTASGMIVDYVFPSDRDWRASNNDLIIGRIVDDTDAIRAINPESKIFEYILMRDHVDRGAVTITRDWALANGYDPEDFYLHYREDTLIPGREGQTFVPGFPPGVVPGWNPDALPTDPPATATSRSQSRIPAGLGGVGGYMPAISHPGYRRFLTEHIGNLVNGSVWGNTNGTGPMEGVMCDVAIYYPEFGEGIIDRSVEYYGQALVDGHPYARAWESFYVELAQGLSNRFGRAIDVMPNYGHAYFFSYESSSADAVRRSTPWGWAEVWLTYQGFATPTSGRYRVINWERDYESGIATVARQSRAGSRRVLGSVDRPLGDGTGTDRGRIFLLALYYLVHNVNTYYIYESVALHGEGETRPMSQWQYNPAIEFDVGYPDVIPTGTVDFDGRASTTEHYIMAQGPDPVVPSLTYRVLARRFTNALVLAKMLPDGSEIDDRSITTHVLDGSYFQLQADGTLGAVVTQIDLRNNEGAILIPVN